MLALWNGGDEAEGAATSTFCCLKDTGSVPNAVTLDFPQAAERRSAPPTETFVCALEAAVVAWDPDWLR